MLFDKDKTTLICCPRGKAGEYVVPDGITSILGNSFSGCSLLTAVSIPEGVTDIGERAFDLCRGLESVSIPVSMADIGWYAFSHCEKLSSVVYSGNEAQWNELKRHIDDTNDALFNADIYFGDL